MAGYVLFQDTIKGRCANCHLNTPDPISGKILFTDHTYNSDGVPKNPNLPYYSIPAIYNALGASYVDNGLGDFVTNDPTQDGAFKVPTLRNIALTAPYFHNGVFTSLETVVHFYNTRDSLGSGFAPAEVNANIDSTDFGNLHMSATDEANIVAFLKTLTDGYVR
jgi:cytochrome c peroxidase